MKKNFIRITILSILALTAIFSLPICANAEWKYDKGNWFYNDNSGNILTGWNKIEGQWYYFNKVQTTHEFKGEMKTGFFKDNDGKVYYFYNNGKMATNTWIKGDKWHYFYNDGSMATNTIIDGYRIDSNGDWIQDNNSITSSNQNNTVNIEVQQDNWDDLSYRMNNMTYDRIENRYDFKYYLDKEYSKLETPIGTLKFTFKIDENTKDFWGYDLEINTDWGTIDNSPYGLYSFHPYDLEHSIKISDEDKEETKRLLKNYQKKIASMAIEKFPNKKIKGGFHTSGYEYQYIRVGYWSTDFLSWNNYDVIDEDEFPDYNNTELSGFHWNTDDDDYDFLN